MRAFISPERVSSQTELIDSAEKAKNLITIGKLLAVK
jgi:hypothetical protein